MKLKVQFVNYDAVAVNALDEPLCMFRATHLCPVITSSHQIPIFIRLGDTERFQGHKVKDTILSLDTPLYPDTYSHQVSTKNLHSFRRYSAEVNFGFKVTESRSKVASTQFFRAAHLCPLIHPPTKYQPKIFSLLGIIERKVNIMQFGVMVTGSRSKITSTQIFCLTHLCHLIHPHPKYQPKIFIRLGDRAEGNFGFKVTGSRVTST
jgi:hypothetical protein